MSKGEKIVLYLDIDGVFLHRTGRLTRTGYAEFEISLGAEEFLLWATERFDCYWLSARSASGSREGVERAFRHASPATMTSRSFAALVQRITPCPWEASKITGIDRRRSFLWVDDDPDTASVAALEASGQQDSLIVVSVDADKGLLGKLPDMILNRLESTVS